MPARYFIAQLGPNGSEDIREGSQIPLATADMARSEAKRRNAQLAYDDHFVAYSRKAATNTPLT